MSQQVNFEVQVQQSGRWSIHARFAGHEKDAAIEEGKQLDQLSNIEAVKVIKEVFDPDKGFHNEFIVYKSANLKSGGGAAAKGGGGTAGPAPSRKDSWVEDDRGGGGAAVDYDEGGAQESAGGRKRPKKKSTLTIIMVKLLMVVLFSICVAALFAVMASELLGGTSLFGVRIIGNAESNMLIGVFVISFLISAVGMAVTVMRGVSLDASGRSRRPARKPPARKAAAKKTAAQKAAAGPSGPTMASLDEAMKGIEEFKIDPEAKAAEDQATTDRLQAELDKDKEKPAEPSEPAAPSDLAGSAEPAPAPAEEEGTPVPTPQGPEAPPLSPHAEKQKAYMMDFLGKALDGCETDKEKMDNFNKFGVNLYLAGACEVLTQTRDVDVLSRTKILADAMNVMGFKKSHAASFADRYEEYLMADSRYMQMFQCGRNAMNLYSTDEDSAPKLLDNALTEWNKPKPKEELTGPITVLFTDIAGSTAMTQALGDEGAQKVVRAHNRIVREALSSCAGKEIKHTGDGIMASFLKTSDGVDAAIQMQRGTDIYTQQTPDFPLHLKIGLNAGEPIAEDNDLFGSTVQMSARIVDKAQADEIFVSEVIRGICAGKDYDFINRGGYPMKGFSEDVTLFEVVWKNSDADGDAG